jgi:hypothetical protein
MPVITCAEFRELAAAFGLGALDTQERAACEAHLGVTASPEHEAEHARCYELARQSADAATLLAQALAPRRPPPAVWSAIAAQLGTPEAAAAPPARPAGGRVLTAVAAAVALAASVACVALWRDRDGWRDRYQTMAARKLAQDREIGALTQARLQADNGREVCLADLQKLKTDSTMRREAVALLERPGTKLIRLEPQGGMGYRAQALVNLEDKLGMVMASGLPRMPGKDFELWVIRGEAKHPAGLLRADADGNVLVKLDEKLLADGPFTALAVTVEPLGGMKQPTGSPVMLGGMGI